MTYHFVGSLPEYSQNIYGTDGWSEVTGDGLDIVEQFPEVLDDWNPHDGDSNQNENADSEMLVKEF